MSLSNQNSLVDIKMNNSLILFVQSQLKSSPLPCYHLYLTIQNLKKLKREGYRSGGVWPGTHTFVLHRQRTGWGTTMRSQRFPNVGTTSQQDGLVG